MKKLLVSSTSLAVLAAVMGPSLTPAQAADVQEAPVVANVPPPVEDTWNPWLIRVQAVDVTSTSNGKSTMVNDKYMPLLNDKVNSPTSSLAMSDTFIPMVNISYFFTKNFAVEFDAGWPPRSTITGTGGLVGLTVGKASALAPALMLQYHYTELGNFKPYVGVGVNYTTFFNVKAANSPASVPATATVGAKARVTDLHIKDSIGPVAQVGFDYMIDKHWGVNVDVKKIWMQPDYTATATADGLAALFNPQHIKGKAHIDPWIIGVGITYRF